ncbi:MAG: 4Fe-4S binding protein [Nitrospiraceae bacterium]
MYYPHCKGCLDCVEVCPTDAMTVERETEATANK